MLTPTVLSYMRPEHRPPSLSPDNRGWAGTYTEALTYIRAGYSDAIQEFREAVDREFVGSNPKIAAGLIECIGYLTEPDPLLRGHIADRRIAHGNQYSVLRFVSAFDRFIKLGGKVN